MDPTIRAEVWEFLLGCYSLGSTTEYRRQLRMARRFVLVICLLISCWLMTVPNHVLSQEKDFFFCACVHVCVCVGGGDACLSLTWTSKLPSVVNPQVSLVESYGKRPKFIFSPYFLVVRRCWRLLGSFLYRFWKIKTTFFGSSKHLKSGCTLHQNE